ncbi:hypothetical protein AAFF_G00344590 [Aldrovandia affinis]|uniref:Uncharacterized protein n=1 Tax=Aldrovandia affinis TaxID=143900 RepID=A0AAD7SKA0_9TELE|nr:hypothetical protein AAFF_G00344590 [Aldrovandia affinis]
MPSTRGGGVHGECARKQREGPSRAELGFVSAPLSALLPRVASAPGGGVFLTARFAGSGLFPGAPSSRDRGAASKATYFLSGMLCEPRVATPALTHSRGTLRSPDRIDIKHANEGTPALHKPVAITRHGIID